ncbi:MAG: aminotransferase class I/II-fold pyridoxal phosphate-dependent enzyme [Clostridia bacterium]|nr:aminotransferase class I/II-fold pyridoxal phosphate-dependent enzyme [Clostridia bacterium]
MRLYDTLAAYSRTDAVPMHMPGHKRQNYDYLAGAHLDITEIDGFDNLHDAEGLLRDAMADAAAVWGSDHAFFSVNGSTGGILAAIHACAGQGGTVLVARNCHKSVWHAIELCRLDPVWLTPPVADGCDIFASMPPEVVEDALEAHPDAKLVVVTSPTYEGVISDIAAIADAAHRRGVPLLVDEAHGAHLGFPPFPNGAVGAGADIVVQSLHKALPSLTQTAIVHLKGSLVGAEALRRALNIFETSSPSYLLMASCDGCARLLRERADLIAEWAAMLTEFRAAAAGLRHLQVFTPAGEGIFGHDPSKLILSTRGTALTGPALMARLRDEHKIELEMASSDYALAMTGLGTTREHLARLARALIAIDSTVDDVPSPAAMTLPPPPDQAMRPADAIWAVKVPLPLCASEGRIAADYLWAYPPGIPLIAPGQRIDRMTLAAIETLRQRGVELPDTVAVCK